MFRNVRLVWEGSRLIFYASFDQDGHDLPVWLDWQAGKRSGRVQIDYIEQYGRAMPVAVTLMSLDKKFLYMGRPAPNTERVDSIANVQGRLVIYGNDSGEEAYRFTVSVVNGKPRVAGPLR
jgi:hypothetical protein